MYVAILIFLMPSLHSKILNGTADLDEKKTWNIMCFILFSAFISVLILLQLHLI